MKTIGISFLDSYLKNSECNNKRFIKELRKIYYSSQLNLVLGSGVSKAAGLPLWPQLVKELYIDVIVNNFMEEEPDWEKLDLKTDELILQARYIKKGYGDLTKFVEAIRKNLYTREVDVDNDLMQAIGRLCVPTRASHLKSIITYNFDDLLEKKLETLKVEYKGIYDSNICFNKSDLPIYHVHGFLPQDSKEVTTKNLIFSDDDYNKQASGKIFSWSNVIQLTSFKDSCNLFIGASFNDSNLRRILEIVKNNFQGVVNYAIQKRSFDSKKQDEKNRKFCLINDYLKENVLDELGIKIIWVDDFSEIPEIIESIK
ncbi:MAG: hypothetical protein C0601_09685 [Candidatus Muiribacterium halophilum]|uniref:Uncharacterized protein n=1 Tax=Muiribacterium halophilum TaxID=2053465 RepID=A0A2N5ZDJ8_MUIH1|nr:MAG: hypothetical protein C0601_09685 [Candidatus Muirbacterium halophilum]